LRKNGNQFSKASETFSNAATKREPQRKNFRKSDFLNAKKWLAFDAFHNLSQFNFVAVPFSLQISFSACNLTQ
jgi:hypothetical protein